MVNAVNTLLSLFNTTNTLVGQTAGTAGPGGHGAPGLLTPHLLVPLHISGSVRLHHEVVAADSSGHCEAWHPQLDEMITELHGDVRLHDHLHDRGEIPLSGSSPLYSEKQVNFWNKVDSSAIKTLQIKAQHTDPCPARGCFLTAVYESELFHCVNINSIANSCSPGQSHRDWWHWHRWPHWKSKNDWNLALIYTAPDSGYFRDRWSWLRQAGESGLGRVERRPLLCQRNSRILQ